MRTLDPIRRLLLGEPIFACHFELRSMIPHDLRGRRPFLRTGAAAAG
jgi:hypothetical protein